MQAEDFVRALAIIILEGTGPGFVRYLEDLPGRRPPQQMIDLAQWYGQLDDVGQQRAQQLIRESMISGVRSFLAVLDGIRAFDPGTVRGRLELTYIRGDERTLLNDNDVLSLDGEFGAIADEMLTD